MTAGTRFVAEVAHGHQGGDVVLRAVAARLQAACRTEDSAGRWGGEEFVVIAPMTGGEGAAQLAERIRCDIADVGVPTGDGPPVEVTVSVGVAAGEDDVEVLLADADAGLYAAKRAGRNRVVTAPGTV